ncbi:hypothetical protein [Burkholderia cenocepacia]|uniref:hypothetical protein n=1 Tax=Burkholderia cenocepacia TaxID=95486 RepID=UPI002854E27D|nr:hypothetical protein [Burkholderia cenocepacia]MDR5660971.1 hypothetical protein [Burkholderia cenocepacia]MDR8094129.1 hypothetical protein [Burkholderia cenocepacia]
MAGVIDKSAWLLDADQHLRQAVYLIAEQECRVARYRGGGLNAELAEELLSMMNTILRTLIVHRQQIVDAIELGRRHRLVVSTNNRRRALLVLADLPRPAMVDADAIR